MVTARAAPNMGAQPTNNGAAMFDQVFDSIRKVSEFSLHMQQETLKYWADQWMSFTPLTGEQQPQWTRELHKRWADAAIDLLNRHRNALDAAYKAGADLIQQTFKVSAAQSPDEYRQTAEDLWRKLFDTFREQADMQLRDLHGWSENTVQDAAHAPSS